MWLLVILAININNPQDIPAKIVLEMPSIHECEQILDTMKYTIKYSSYKVEGSCQRKF